MRTYRLNEAGTPGVWPFLLARHAYLANGTPLTECDDEGRVIPASHIGNSLTKICSGGSLSLADRERGIAALARALDKGDLVRAPILLLQLQIDPAPELSKFNPNHKPAGPGGGQFTSAPGNGAVLSPADSLSGNYNDDDECRRQFHVQIWNQRARYRCSA